MMFILKLITKQYISFKFNYTRISWSKGYQCNYRDVDEMNVLIISGTVLVLTISFYITVRLMAHEEKRQIIQIRNSQLIYIFS